MEIQQEELLVLVVLEVAVMEGKVMLLEVQDLMAFLGQQILAEGEVLVQLHTEAIRQGLAVLV